MARGSITLDQVAAHTADRILRTDILVQGFWQKQGLAAVVAGDVRHTAF